MSLVVGTGLLTLNQALALAATISAVGVGLYLATAETHATAMRRAVRDSRMAHGLRGLRAIALDR